MVVPQAQTVVVPMVAPRVRMVVVPKVAPMAVPKVAPRARMAVVRESLMKCHPMDLFEQVDRMVRLELAEKKTAHAMCNTSY